jgi:hypothetical protein
LQQIATSTQAWRSDGHLLFQDAALFTDEAGAFGGTCINRGCIPSKILVHTADVALQIDRAAGFGIDAEVTVVLDDGTKVAGDLLLVAAGRRPTGSGPWATPVRRSSSSTGKRSAQAPAQPNSLTFDA